MIYKGLVLNDYPDTPYAQWVKEGRKKIETRMNRIFSFRGDVVICCGKSKSVGPNAGKALCIVEVYKGRPMIDDPAEIAAACIGFDVNRKSLLLRNWRHFNYDFEFAKCAIQKNFQGMFDMKLPDDVVVIPKPDIMPFVLSDAGLNGLKATHVWIDEAAELPDDVLDKYITGGKVTVLNPGDK